MASADQLIATLSNLDSGSFANEGERIRARDALFDALRKVQSPWDIAWEHNWVNPATNAAIKTLIDAGVFKKWAEAGHGNKTSEELAQLTGADALLIRTLVMKSICTYIDCHREDDAPCVRTTSRNRSR